MTRLLSCLAAISLLAGITSGCSSSRVPVTAAVDSPARTTASAELGRRTIRPIPEVITKPKPFRLPDAVGGPQLLDRPATMLAELDLTAVEVDDVEFPSLVSTPRAPAKASGPAVTEIRDMMRSYLRAFNRHDVTALASHWSETGESLDLDSGETTAGRNEVAGVFAALFAEDGEATIDIDIASIKPIRDDVAVIDGVSLISFADDATAASRFSALVVREGGRWMLSSVREAAAPVPDRQRRPLDALDWLVGTWEDVTDGLTANTRCTWSPGRAFLVRSHMSTPDASAATPAEGVPALLPAEGVSREVAEIIGWDPKRGRIRSWVFSSDGRFAEGEWSRVGEGDEWTVTFKGQGADADLTTNRTIRRHGKDGVVVTAGEGPLATALPPTADFVRTALVGE